MYRAKGKALQDPEEQNVLPHLELTISKGRKTKT